MNVFDFKERAGSMVDSEAEDLASAVIGCAIEVHKGLGPGMPERSYLLALSQELSLRQIPHRIEVSVPIVYKGEPVGRARIDLLVAERLVVELKCVEALNTVHKMQTLMYLRLLKLQLGLLINFNVAVLRNGIKRVIHTEEPS